MKRQPFKLTPALAYEHTGGTLALDPRAIGRSFALAPSEPDDASKLSEETGEVVGIIEIHGPLMQRATSHLCGYSDGYDAIAARFEAAMRDDEVSRVVLLIDSPGGDAAGLFESIDQMRAVKAEIGKTVQAYADEIAGSAAYALACVADEIYLPRSGSIGSVGCVCIHVDETEAAKKAGLEFTVFRNPARKFEGNSIEPLTEEAAAAIQDRIDGLAEQFFELVAEARGMSVAAVKALEGAMFGGPSAVKKGLADGLETKENVMNGKAKKSSASTSAVEKKQPTPAPATSAPARAESTDSASDEEMKKLRAENDELKAKLAKYEDEEAEDSAEDGDDSDEDEDEGDDDEDAPPSSKDGARAAVAATAPKKTKRELELEAELHESKVTAVLDKASAKVTPAGRKAWRAFAKVHGIDALKHELAALPDHPAAGKGPTAGSTPKTPLSSTDRKVAMQLGIPEDAFADGKAATIEASKAKENDR